MEVESSDSELWESILDDALKETLDDGEMILRWVTLAEVLDKDGERWLYTMTSPDLKIWETLGMLRYALAKEENNVGQKETEE